jgi:hypothetical protein
MILFILQTPASVGTFARTLNLFQFWSGRIRYTHLSSVVFYDVTMAQHRNCDIEDLKSSGMLSLVD